jgi:group I intron endonuclease
MIYGIYQIKNVLNGRVYIGSSINEARQGVAGRLRDHRNNLIKDQHCNIHLQRAWNKYGEDAFVFGIIEEVEHPINTGDELWKLIILSREQYYLDTVLLASCNDERFRQLGYNICRIAGNTLGVTHSHEVKAKMKKSRGTTKYRNNISAKMKGNRNCLGRILSQETKDKISAARKGIYVGERHPRAKLTRLDVVEIKVLLQKGQSQASIARRFDVSSAAIHNIRVGLSWRHI